MCDCLLFARYFILFSFNVNIHGKNSRTENILQILVSANLKEKNQKIQTHFYIRHSYNIS